MLETNSFIGLSLAARSTLADLKASVLPLMGHSLKAYLETVFSKAGYLGYRRLQTKSAGDVNLRTAQ